MVRFAHVWIGLLALCACESDAEKCQKARAAAKGGWAAYVALLEQTQAQATKTQTDGHARLRSVVEPRLLPEAQKIADSRYDPGSEAWLRANRAAFSELCTKDAECNDLRGKEADAKRLLEDLAERMPLARRARDATQTDPERAKADAEAAIIDPERPQLKAAQQLSLELHERCKDVPVDPESEAQSP